MHLLLDRDGVINRYIENQYVSRVEDVAFIPGSLEAIKMLCDAGYKIIVVSNQAGVGKGLLAEEMLQKITEAILSGIRDAGGRVEDVIYCLHAPDAGCDCRKPRPGMLLEAARRHGFELKETFFVGDNPTDAKAAEAAGCRSILVRSGHRAVEPVKADFVVDNLHDAATKVILRPGRYERGDIEGYQHALWEMRSRIDSLKGRVLVAHHGDCDGITGGGLLAAYLMKRDVEVSYASAAEFRAGDVSYFEKAVASCSAGIFVEAQGMPPDYARLDGKFLNIDHHPHPPDTPIRRMLNPRSHAITPNPAIGLVVYELLADAISEAEWLAALASIVDYCRAPAELLIEKHRDKLARIDDLRDTFLASQYVLPFTTELAAFIATLPGPDDLLAREPFASRRELFKSRISDALSSSRIGPRLVVAETIAGDMRIASPLANRLGDLHPTKCVVVIEASGHNARLSVRQRSEEIHIGRVLGEIVKKVCGDTPEADGTGHEKAGSARIPRSRTGDFLRELEEKIG